MAKNPAQELAPHVRAAIAAVAQPKIAEEEIGGREPAAHVQAAISGLSPTGIQRSRRKKGGDPYGKAQRCWNSFCKYNLAGAQDIERRMARVVPYSKVRSQILTLMIQWGYLGGYTGHGSGGRGSKKRSGTDERTREIRESFDSWLRKRSA